MKFFFIFLSFIILSNCGNSEMDTTHSDKTLSGNKRRSLAIAKEAQFINIELHVFPHSSNTIIAEVKIINNSDSPYVIYKPLLPFEGFTENIFAIFECKDYQKVKFIGNNQESYIEDKYPPLIPLHVVPRIYDTNFVVLKPKSSLVIQANIAHKYDFKKFIDEKNNDFKLSYSIYNPIILQNKQEYEIDSLDGLSKPVYNLLHVEEKEDVDSMRIEFKIP